MPGDFNVEKVKLDKFVNEIPELLHGETPNMDVLVLASAGQVHVFVDLIDRENRFERTGCFRYPGDLAIALTSINTVLGHGTNAWSNIAAFVRINNARK